ncbi:MAG: cytochrome c3 family protein [Desulfobulbaceae bacterium]|nr:cytochrome c3 family protein [Desulfobulbaceae bacterium]
MLAVFCWPGLLFAGSVHDNSAVRCLDCHIALPLENRPLTLHDDVSDICLRCHDAYPCKTGGESSYFSHPIGIVPSLEVPDDMPLDAEKRMGCMTCHKFHDGAGKAVDLYPSYLRRSPGLKLCFACHGKLR